MIDFAKDDTYSLHRSLGMTVAAKFTTSDTFRRKTCSTVSC